MASEIAGNAKVLDSTRIEIDGQRIMLFGTDSVMRKQSCMANGKVWPCWEAAVRDLQTLVSQGAATCEVVGEPDPYGRVLGRCKINGTSLNEQYVRDGYALARPSETTDYVAAEAEAKGKKIGLWQGQFMATIRVSDEGRHFRRTPLRPIGRRAAPQSLRALGGQGVPHDSG